MNIADLYELFKKNPSVQTDTRKLKKGDIFFALKGPSFNGNEFAKQALDAGASYAVIDEQQFEIPTQTIVVGDALASLQELAHHHRKQFTVPFLAITGSNGKTTTKELIHAVLSTTCRTYTTEGNLNNHIGIPLTLLKIKDDAEIVVIEMGANHLGEIASYCEIVEPTHGLITNCGKAHLEGFGSEEGVRKGKGELFDYLRTVKGGVAFIMSDYDYLHQMSSGISIISTYGSKNGADVVGKVLKNDPLLEVEISKGIAISNIRTQLVGEYNLPNVLSAVAVGKYFNVAADKIKNAIEEYSPSNSRSQLIYRGSNKIVLDAYNANPSSMKLAIDNFSKIAGDKVLMLGSMAELGQDSEREHAMVVAQIESHSWKNVLLVGNEFAKVAHPFIQLSSSAEAKDWLQRQHLQQTNILIKGSRSTRMEQSIE